MELLYADKRIAVAVKPPGILSTDEPGGMPELLRRQLGTPCIRTVHRLDAATGGVMVFARSAAAASILSGQVRDHQFRKTYLAVVRGDPGHSGTWRDLLGRDPVRRRTVVAQEPGPDVRPAELDFQRLASRDGLSLVRITLHTGRTHQIRVQFASRGFPLVGDRKISRSGRAAPRRAPIFGFRGEKFIFLLTEPGYIWYHDKADDFAEGACGCSTMARAPAFQAGDAGSIPVTRSTYSCASSSVG